MRNERRRRIYPPIGENTHAYMSAQVFFYDILQENAYRIGMQWKEEHMKKSTRIISLLVIVDFHFGFSTADRADCEHTMHFTICHFNQFLSLYHSVHYKVGCCIVITSTNCSHYNASNAFTFYYTSNSDKYQVPACRM